MNETTPIRLATLGWPWQSEDPAIHIILVSDQQFVNLADHPDEAVEKIHPQAPAPISLREHCRHGAEAGATKLLIAYDYFFGGSTRGLYPDTASFQETLKKVHDVAREYGLGLEPSIISPLELGPGYKASTGEAGRWLHYREGLRDPSAGAYSVTMWQQIRWCNNKGPMPVKLIGARAFAFREERIPNTPFFAVNPDSIVELSSPHIETMAGTGVNTEELAGGTAERDVMFRAARVRVWGEGGPKGPDRVLLVLLYETVEMDYFSPSAAAFLDDLAQAYHRRGISLAGIYSDEMHIQQDWSYHAHLDNGQFSLRYASPGFEKAFAARYGSQYVDFAKYMLYFACHQHDFLPTHEPKLPSQHVFGSGVQDIYDTFRFRRNYYHFLESTIVNLSIRALKKLEALTGHELDLFYHATWAESPTCDAWAVGGVHESWSPEEHQRQYEYTPDFLWSNTVQQAASACANYFLWNEFLTGGNNDTAEGGYADRNYYGRALACSLAALNRRPLANAGMWGMPQDVRPLMTAVTQVFGAGGHPAFRSVADYASRCIEVLFLYPQDLVAVDERFGSWMVQYGYANTITAEKLVEYGSVTEDGLLAVKNSRYRALCALYEPLPEEALLALLKAFVEKGGLLIWSSVPPPQAEARDWLAETFGVRVTTMPDPLGLPLPARQIVFEGVLAGVPPQMVLTDFPVDRLFPLEPFPGTERVASVQTGGLPQKVCVGTYRPYPSGGQAVYLGFRPRDDQSASTGVEARTWFEVLHALGAYPASGAFAESDNPTVISRTTEWLACAFPNGALAVCPHHHHHVESWRGGFFRNEEGDQCALAANPVPNDDLALRALPIAGQRITYQGRHAVIWRCDDRGNLLAFAGKNSTGIEINRRRFAWSDRPVDIAWHPLMLEQQTDAYVPLYRIWVGTAGQVYLPLDLGGGEIEVWQGAYQSDQRESQPAAVHPPAGSGMRQIPFMLENGLLRLDVDTNLCGHWLYVVRPKPRLECVRA